MSHFTVAVIGKNMDEEALTQALRPFHEFECTGKVDEFVHSIDITEQAIQAYEKATSNVVVYADGSMKSIYSEDAFLSRDPTAEELVEIEMRQKDYRHKVDFRYEGKSVNGELVYKVRYLPEGAEEREVRTAEFESFEDYIPGYFGVSSQTIGEHDEADLEGTHKYGYIVRMNDGTYKVFDRTNPKAEWDWYQLGGRWSGALKAKSGATSGVRGSKSWMSGEDEVPADHFDMLKKSEIDLTGMMEDRIAGRRQAWEQVCTKYRALMEDDTVDSAFIDEMRGSIIAEKKMRFKAWEALEVAEGERKLPFWDWIAERMPERFVKASHIFSGWFSDISGSEDYRSIEDWIQDVTPISTFAVLKDGEWYAKGEMGWFGMSDDKLTEEQWSTKMRELIDGLDDDDVVAIVDCHI
jgi:hypothetical protein